jgi:inorganic triphosphatase YgiF
MSKAREEVEFKAGLDTATLARLRRHPALRPATSGRAVTRKLVSIYYDAGDLRLMQAGLFLRMRREGGRWVQTVKAARRAGPGLQRVTEVNDPAPDRTPDLARISVPALRDTLENALAGAALLVACRSDISRTTRLLRGDGGIVELAFDRGEVSAGEAVDAFCELEIESLEGGAAPVWAWAQRLLAHETARLVQPSKAARGFTLAAGGELPPCRPLRSNPAALGTREDADSACSATLALLARAIAENLHCVLNSDDPEGAHQFRVALRRLRALLQAGDGLLRRRTRDLARPAKALGRIAGRLRDADVLAATLQSQAPGADAAAVERWRTELRSVVRDELLAAGATAFAIELLRHSDEGLWRPRHKRRKRLARPVARALAPALDAQYRRLCKRGDRLHKLDRGGRHRLRKDLKTLRYMLELAALDGRVRDTAARSPTLKALGRLQTALGALNDADNLAAAAAALPRPELRQALKAASAGGRCERKAARRRELEKARRAWRKLRKNWPR